MSKVAAYLQEHILGEVSTNTAILDAMSRDMSVLRIQPEMVIYPRVTNDIRKIARFSWQLAEKGHILPITARGSGSDQTGAAIGKGAVVVLPAHMNRIFEYEAKQKLVRVQPGVSTQALTSGLLLQGVAVPPLPQTGYNTVGGAVANNASNELSGKYGSTKDWVHQLEIVLANGDVLQTGRLSKRELNKKKGLQNLEGEIYRKIDSLIEDNTQVIEEKISGDVRDNVGYSSIAQVKQKDGSFDLTPLFTGSQGTLGIISEMIMKAEFMSAHMSIAAIVFANANAARDALDQLCALEPAFVDYFDGELFKLAAAQGKTYDFYKAAIGDDSPVVLIGFDDFNERLRSKRLKRITKLLRDTDASVVTATGDAVPELLAVREVTAFTLNPATHDMSAPPLFDGAYVPSGRSEDFSTAVAALAAKYHVSLPLHARVLEGVYFTRAILHLQKVSDKQKIFKLLDEYASLVDHHGGHLIGDNGEGRVKSPFAYKQLDDDVRELFTAIKDTFDPFGILNPGVKQQNELRQLVSSLRTGYDTGTQSTYVPYN